MPETGEVVSTLTEEIIEHFQRPILTGPRLNEGEKVVAFLIDVDLCPSCNEPWESQERTPNGKRTCANRHTWIRTRKEYFR